MTTSAEGVGLKGKTGHFGRGITVVGQGSGATERAGVLIWVGAIEKHSRASLREGVISDKGGHGGGGERQVHSRACMIAHQEMLCTHAHAMHVSISMQTLAVYQLNNLITRENAWI